MLAQQEVPRSSLLLRTALHLLCIYHVLHGMCCPMHKPPPPAKVMIGFSYFGLRQELQVVIATSRTHCAKSRIARTMHCPAGTPTVKPLAILGTPTYQSTACSLTNPLTIGLLRANKQLKADGFR